MALRKLLLSPVGNTGGDAPWCVAFDWTGDEFTVWVSNWWWNDFIHRLADILGQSIFDDGGTNAKIQDGMICFALSDATDGIGIDLEKIFPKEECTIKIGD